MKKEWSFDVFKNIINLSLELYIVTTEIMPFDIKKWRYNVIT